MNEEAKRIAENIKNSFGVYVDDGLIMCKYSTDKESDYRRFGSEGMIKDILHHGLYQNLFSSYMSNLNHQGQQDCVDEIIEILTQASNLEQIDKIMDRFDADRPHEDFEFCIDDFDKHLNSIIEPDHKTALMELWSSLKVDSVKELALLSGKR